MHYIVGTRFTIAPGARLTASINLRKFTPSVIYTLISISKKEDNFKYIFSGSNKTNIELEFISCNEADKFLSIVRNEKLPDYYNNTLEANFTLDD